MLGHMILNYLPIISDYQVFSVSRYSSEKKNHIVCDVKNRDDLKKIIKYTNPNYVVNCIGILKNKSSNNISDTIYLNSYLPHYLDSLSKKFKFKLIHISTDCVFDGKSGSYNEDSFKSAKDLYGASKSIGEINNSYNLTIRTSIIGPELNKNGSGLFNWFTNQKGEVNGYTHAFWSGVTTLELTNAINFCIENKISGLWNLTNGIPISKYDLLKIIKEKFDLDLIRLVKFEKFIDNKSLISNRKINYIVPDYQTMIESLKNFIKSSSTYNESN